MIDSEKRRAQKAAACRRWRAAHPDRIRAGNQKWAKRRSELQRFRLTGWRAEEYEAAVAAQLGRCAICLKEPVKPLQADHDHKTGRRRELLCGDCNRALGLLQDNPDLLNRAAEYVQRHAKGIA